MLSTLFEPEIQNNTTSFRLLGTKLACTWPQREFFVYAFESSYLLIKIKVSIKPTVMYENKYHDNKMANITANNMVKMLIVC